MDARVEPGPPPAGARHHLSALAVALRCSPAEAVAVCVLVVGAFAGLGLLWVLASPHLPGPPAAPIVEGLVAGSASSPAPGDGSSSSSGVPGAAATLSAGAEPAGTANGDLAASPAELVVHVAGRVARPGIYRLPAGSRVADALAASGGVLADADAAALNLARVLVDGEQVRVPAVGEQLVPAPSAGPGGGPSAGGARRADGTLDLNLAALADLDQLPGVGPVLAQRILDHRAEIGRFRSVEELRDVKGIGEATYAELAPEVSV